MKTKTSTVSIPVGASNPESLRPRKIALVDETPINAREARKVRAFAEQEYSKIYPGIVEWLDKHYKELCDSRPVMLARDSKSGEVVGFIIGKTDRRPEVKISFLFALPEYGSGVLEDLVRGFEWWAASDGKYKVRKHIYRERWDVEIPIFEHLGYYRGRYNDPEEAVMADEERVRRMFVRDFRSTYWPTKPVAPSRVVWEAPKVRPTEAKLRISMPIGKGRGIVLRVESDSVALLYYSEAMAEGTRLSEKALSMIRK